MKKIVHVIIGLNQGGAETMLYKLCKAMANKSTYDITVISLIDRGVFADKLEKYGVKVYALNLSKLNAISVIYKYVKIIRKIKPDVIHSWMYHANVISIFCRSFYKNAKYVNSIRMGLENYKAHKCLTKFIIMLNAKISKFADVTLNNSNKSLKDHQKIGFKKQKFIANGFDSDIFRPDILKYKKFRLSNNLEENATIIGIIARNHPDKNISRFLQIANLLLKNNFNFYFFIAGRDCSHIDICSYLDNKDNLHNFFVFESVDSSEYLPILDIYLSTSKVEGFPNIIAESMLCEVPVVASNVGECGNLISKFGEVFELDQNNEEIIQKIIKSLQKSEVIKKNMREYIVNNFSIEAILKKHELIYFNGDY